MRKLPRVRFLLVALVSLLAAPTWPAPPPVVALAASAPIVVDGVLDEAAWQAGAWSSDFRVLDLPEQPAEVQTRFKVRFDGEHVYVGAVADEPHPDQLRIQVVERDGKVYGDDCLEVMLDPTGERIEYYHLVVSAAGVLYDAQRRQGGHVHSVEWNGSALAATRVGDDRWTLELRIPVVELGLTAASTSDWAINVTRERQVEPRELSTFAPLTGGFHQPSLYAPLRLQDADFGAFLWELGQPRDGHARPELDGSLTYGVNTTVRNAGASQRRIRARGVVDGLPGPWVDATLAPGGSAELSLRVPGVTQGPAALFTELVDADNATHLLARQSEQVEIAYRPLSIEVLQPGYRNDVYATEDLEQVVFAVRSDLPAVELRAFTVQADLITPAGGTVATDRWPADPLPEGRLPIAAFQTGEYTLRVRLIDGRRVIRHEAWERIRKLPRVEHEWRIDAQGVLRHNGEPVLPFGWFSIPPEAMAAGGHAYVLMQAYSSYYQSVAEVRAFLDRVAAAGTATTIYPYPDPSFVSPASVWAQPLTAGEAEALRLRVRALKDHPGLFAWYMADEPELRPALPERCRRIYEIVRDEDPYHPCIMLNDTMEGIRRYRDGGDVLMPDPYPCFMRGGPAAQPLEKVGHFIAAAGQAAAGHKAVWITPQGFNYGDYGKQNQRAPHFSELRNMVYQAVAHGARGFLWYTWAHAANYPDLGIGMPWLSYEVADLKPAILAPESDPAPTVKAAHPEHLHVSARRAGGAFYLFVASTATEPQEVEIALRGLADCALHVVSEGRQVAVRRGVLHDRFDAYGTHVYTTDARLAGRPEIDAVRQRIARADGARRKEGNLAFEDRGTRVEYSSKSTYGSTPDRVLDGVTGGMRWRDGTAGQTPDWLTVLWPSPVTVDRVVVYSDTISELEVRVPDAAADGGWRTVARGAANRGAADGGEAITARLARPISTAAARVVVTALREGEEYSTIYEVESYGH